MRKIKIDIGQNTCNYIEQLHFDLLAYERIIKYMLTDSSFENLDENSNSQKYHERYEKKITAFEFAKEELVTTFIPTKLREHNISWNLDFTSHILTITVNCVCIDSLSVKEMKGLLNNE